MIDSKKEKLYIYIAISAISLILLIVIFIIWGSYFSSFSSKNINKYDDTVTYEDIMQNYYSYTCNRILNIINYDELFTYIGDEYKNNIGITDKDELKSYLRDNNFISTNILINNIYYITDGINNIFKVDYNVHNKNKNAIITEKEPYIFDISFEQDDFKTILKQKSPTLNYNNIEYKFEIVSSNNNSINYKITITNNDSSTYKFDFSALNSLRLRYNGEYYVNMAAVANSPTVDYNITPGSSKSINVLFNLSFDNQYKIDGFVFNNVLVDGQNKTIEVTF